MINKLPEVRKMYRLITAPEGVVMVDRILEDVILCVPCSAFFNLHEAKWNLYYDIHEFLQLFEELPNTQEQEEKTDKLKEAIEELKMECGRCERSGITLDNLLQKNESLATALHHNQARKCHVEDLIEKAQAVVVAYEEQNKNLQWVGVDFAKEGEDKTYYKFVKPNSLWKDCSEACYERKFLIKNKEGEVSFEKYRWSKYGEAHDLEVTDKIMFLTDFINAFEDLQRRVTELEKK